jgi:PIN domain nuclease of toxin-antitoxin system
MRLLLDTQVWLWLQSEPERVIPSVRDALADPQNELLLSAASAWEIAIKHGLGKLPLPLPPEQYVPARMELSDTASLPVSAAHALRVASLPVHHRDPFDRLLLAQAQLERISLVTADRQLAPYDVELIWAA